MKKLINDKNNIVEEVVQGMIKAFPDKVSRVENEPIIIRKNKKVDKVALISGGGSGHEPAHAGYVGYGMLDAAVCGEIFTSPGADKVYNSIKAVDAGKGVLLIIIGSFSTLETLSGNAFIIPCTTSSTILFLSFISFFINTSY